MRQGDVGDYYYLIQSGSAAVSYTHLDVYKRQLTFRSHRFYPIFA